MATCNGCGGKIGRDCFNPMECEQIAYNEQQHYNRNGEQALTEIEQLKLRVEELERKIEQLLPTIN